MTSESTEYEEERVSQSKPFDIAKQEVWEAYKCVKRNNGAAGSDGQTIEEFEIDLKGNLYKIWNRMASGSYFPPSVKLVEIPKRDGKQRPLGIPTVMDRIAQQVVKRRLEPMIDVKFHKDSYGYRRNKSALDAVGKARERCWLYDWVIDLDIKGFFDSINHELLMKAVRKHTQCKWALLYIERWLKAPVKLKNGELKLRMAGTPQGGVLSPLLANLFLHYAFDKWIQKLFPKILFERYADDIVIHCRTKSEAEKLLEVIDARFVECKLQLHADKTKIVYCKDSNRRVDYPEYCFDFLGYTFRPRKAVNKRGQYFISFAPAISNYAAKLMRKRLKLWMLHRQVSKSIEEIAAMINPTLRGWINYYGRYYPSALTETFSCLNRRLAKWGSRKYKRMRGRKQRAGDWLANTARKQPTLFAHWKMLGITSFHW